MLDYFFTVVQQIFAMTLMVLAGFLCYKFKILTDRGIKEFSSVLLKIVMPMIVISAFQRPFESALAGKWFSMLGISLFTYLLSIAIAELFYKNPDTYARGECLISVSFPNCGFLAFPILNALAGPEGIFMGSASVILLNIIQWTYGTIRLCPGQKINIRNILLNPGVIAIVASLLLFVSPVKLPAPVFQAVDAIGSLNTPLAMIVLGGMLAQTDMKSAFTTLSYYKPAFLKLIIVPLVMLVVLYFIPLSNIVKLVAFVCSVVPTATSVSMLSHFYGRDYRYATSMVVIITVLSVITMPVLLALGKQFLGY